jgi:GNAT superfamily N-acetyltransferase
VRTVTKIVEVEHSTTISLELHDHLQMIGRIFGVKRHKETSWYIASILVLKQARSRGYGEFLLRRFEAHAWALDPAPIELIVSAFSDGLSQRKLWAWYRKRGYERRSGKTAFINPPQGISKLEVPCLPRRDISNGERQKVHA